MKIVSDTGPIIGLAKIGKIILLKNIADEVISACPKSLLFVISTKGRNLECQYYQRDKISRYARNDSLTYFSDRH